MQAPFLQELVRTAPTKCIVPVLGPGCPSTMSFTVPLVAGFQHLPVAEPALCSSETPLTLLMSFRLFFFPIPSSVATASSQGTSARSEHSARPPRGGKMKLERKCMMRTSRRLRSTARSFVCSAIPR